MHSLNSLGKIIFAISLFSCFAANAQTSPAVPAMFVNDQNQIGINTATTTPLSGGMQFGDPDKESALKIGTNNHDYNVITTNREFFFNTYANNTFSNVFSFRLSKNNFSEDAVELMILNTKGDVLAHSFNNSSDQRLKKNFTKLENPIKKVLALNAYYFYWKDKDKGTEKEFGVIAQEVEKVLPEIVRTGANGYKTVEYSKLSVLLIEAVKEQNKTIEQLKKIVCLDHPTEEVCKETK